MYVISRLVQPNAQCLLFGFAFNGVTRKEFFALESIPIQRQHSIPFVYIRSFLTMPEATTILKGFLSASAIPGVFWTLMGLGIVPLDKTKDIAAPFIEPLGIPTNLFLCILGPAKILGVSSLWGYGPMPELVGRLGLTFSALCGAYGHASIGETPLPPIIYAAMMGGLFILERSASKAKKA